MKCAICGTEIMEGELTADMDDMKVHKECLDEHKNKIMGDDLR